MQEKLKIIIFPNSYDESDIIFSTTTKIAVNKTGSLYHINYKLKDYLQLDPNLFAKALSETFNTNMPGIMFDMNIIGKIDKNDLTEMMPPVSIGKILKLSEMYEAFKTNSANISIKDNRYARSEKIVQSYLKQMGPLLTTDDDDYDDNEDDYDDNEYDDDLSRNDQYYSEDDYDEDDVADVTDTINNILGMGDMEYIHEHDYDPISKSDYEYKRSKKYKSYPSSKILKSSKHAKRDIKRHGIIIESGKSRNKDEETIKAFLKDFIPGKSRWIKSYRKIILRRWMNQYAITKKAARKFDKQNQEMQKVNKKGKVSIDTASKVTRSILKHYNPFYDTSK